MALEHWRWKNRKKIAKWSNLFYWIQLLAKWSKKILCTSSPTLGGFTSDKWMIQRLSPSLSSTLPLFFIWSWTVGSSVALPGHLPTTKRLSASVDVAPPHKLIGQRLDGWGRQYGLVHLKIRQKLESVAASTSGRDELEFHWCCYYGRDMASLRLETSSSSAMQPLLPLGLIMEMLYQKSSSP